MSGGYGSNGNRGLNLDGFSFQESNVFIAPSKPKKVPKKKEVKDVLKDK